MLQEPPKSCPEPSKRRPTGLQDLPSGLPIRGRRQEGVSPLNPATELPSRKRRHLSRLLSTLAALPARWPVRARMRLLDPATEPGKAQLGRRGACW